MFEGNRTYSFQNILIFSFFVLYCICQYIDEVSEENWQNVLLILILAIFTNIL